MKVNHMKINEIQYNYNIRINEKTPFPPLFFVNGAFQSKKSWDYLSNILQNQYTIITADLPGWGSATKLPPHHDFTILSEAIALILEQEAIEKIILISTSYGSNIATTFAAQYKNKIDKLMLCSPFLEISDCMAHHYPEMCTIVETGDTEQLNEFLCGIGLVNCLAGQNGQIKNFAKLLPLFKRKIETLSKHDLVNFLYNTHRIKKFGSSSLELISDIDTLVVTGEYDTFTRPTSCKEIANKFSTPKFDFIRNADHMFLFEQPEYFAKMIMDFSIEKASQISRRLRA